MTATTSAGNDLTEEIIGDLLSLLERLPSLQKLYLDDSEMTLEAMTALSKAMRQRKVLQKLTTLSLCSCELTAAGAVQIAR
jgi:Ran GTPase-activating protein (RanGAP) involved in mRNA processing and transport